MAKRYAHIREEFRPFLAAHDASSRSFDEDGAVYERHNYQFFLPFSKRRGFNVTEEFEDGKRVAVFAGFSYEVTAGRINTADSDTIEALLAKGAAILASRGSLPAGELARRPGKRAPICVPKPPKHGRELAALSVGG
jgi:hypothetical protein